MFGIRGPERAALLVLGVAAVLGCVGLGAPPRMDAVEGVPGWVALLLESLAPQFVVQVGIAVAAAVLVAGGAWTRESVRDVWPLLLLLALGAIQLVPIPGFVRSLAQPGVEDVRAQVADTGWLAPMSVWPDGTLGALLVLLGVVAAATAARRAGAARAVLVFVAVVATIESAYGLASTHFGSDTVLGMAKVSGNGRVTGSFVLAPMLAAWAGMGACCALGLATTAWVRARRAPAAVWLAASALCATAAALSLSRLFLVACAVGLCVTAWFAAGALSAAGRTGAGRAARLLSIAVPALAVVSVFVVPTLRERASLLLNYLDGTPGPVEPRFAGWESTWDLFLEAPLLGTGLGSFGRAIHITQSTDSAYEMWFAHSDVLNLLSDAGIVGFALAAWWVVARLRSSVTAARVGEPEARLVAGAALGASCVVLVGALADFQTQFAVVAMPFAALLALGGAAEREHESESGPRPVVLGMGVGLTAAGVALLAFAPRFLHAADGLAPAATAAERDVVRTRAIVAGAAAAADPVSAIREAVAIAEDAARDDPFHDAAHLWTALVHAAVRGAPDEGVDHHAEALAALDRARLVSRGHAGVNLQIGLLYLDLGEQERALPALREAGMLDPGVFSRAWDEAIARGLGSDALRAITPPTGLARRRLARHLTRSGEPGLAIEVLEEALTDRPWDEHLQRALDAARARLRD